MAFTCDSIRSSSVRSIFAALRDDDVCRFRSLLKQGTIGFCSRAKANELNTFGYLNPACFYYFQQRLAQQHYLPRMTVHNERDWLIVETTRDFLMELCVGKDGFQNAKFDTLLDCRHLRSVCIDTDSNTSTHSVAHLLGTLAFLPSLESLTLIIHSTADLELTLSSMCRSSSSTSFSLSLPSAASPFDSFSSSCSSFFFPRFFQLQSLNINAKVDEICPSLFTFLQDACPHLSALHIHIQSYPCLSLTCEQIHAIASLSLRSLSLEHCGLTNEQCTILCDYSHSSLSHLHSLDLSDNPSLSSTSLSVLLSHFPSLTHVNLSWNAFDILTAHTLLAHLPLLTHLWLRGCDLTDECVTLLSALPSLIEWTLEDLGHLTCAIGTPLAHMSTLSTLTFMRLYPLGNSSSLGDLPKSNSLRTLHIRDMWTDDKDFIYLATTSHSSLTSLTIDSLAMTDKAIIELMNPYSSHIYHTLSSLHVSSSILGDRAATALSQSYSLTDLFLSKVSMSEQGLLALARIPQLLRLTIAELPLPAATSRVLSQFASHSHLEDFSFECFSFIEQDVSPFLLALPLHLLRNKRRRQWWLRICCLIAFERGYNH